MKQIEGGDLGLGSLSFLDDIAGKVKKAPYGEILCKHGLLEYDFNHNTKEVLLNFPEIFKMK